MYTEEISREDRIYYALSLQGIFVYNLQGQYSPPGQSWTLQVTITGPLSRFQAKAPLERYLTHRYKASGITFLRSRWNKENQFYVQFFRGDL
jgi:hypothetical protein